MAVRDDRSLWNATGIRAFSSGAAPRLFCALGGIVIVLASGCGKTKQADRTPLRGHVTIAGRAPAINGTVYFDPLGQSGVGSSAEVAPDGTFEVSPDTGPTPGLKYTVSYITSPGIPADGTPLDSIELSQTYRTEVDIPAADDVIELKLDFEDVNEN